MIKWFSTAIVLLCSMAATALSKITPTTDRDYVLGPKDITAVRMVELFDLSQAKSPWFKAPSGMTVFNASTEVVTKSLTEFNVQDIHQIIDMGNGLVGILYNKKSLMVLPISKDGKSIGTPRVFNNTRLGTYEMCDDLVINTELARIYMSCHDENASKEEPGNSYIYEIDYQDLSQIQRIVIDQSDGFFVEVSSKLRLFDHSVSGSAKGVLILYSQTLVGTGSTLGTSRFLRYCTNADRGNLKCDAKNVINLTNSNLYYRSLYDIYIYNNFLMFTGVPATGDGNVTITPCYLDPERVFVGCFDVPRDTGISKGWAGVVSAKNFIKVDMITSTISLCDFEYHRTNSSWTFDCHYNESVDVYPDMFIREVEFGNTAAMIEFAHPDSTYYGYATHHFFDRFSHANSKSTEAAALAEDRLIRVDTTSGKQTVGIVWLSPEFMLVDGSKNQGNQTIQVMAYDQETPNGVTATITVEGLKDYIGDIRFKKEYVVPEIDVLQGTYYMWPYQLGAVVGNAISYDLGFDDDIAGLFETHLYHTSNVDYNLKSDDPGNLDLIQVITGDGYLIGFDRRNFLVFYKCVYSGIAQADCIAVTAIQQDKDIKLLDKTAEILGSGFVFTISSKGTVVYSFTGLTVQTYSLNIVFPSDIDAFVASDADKRLIGVVAVGITDKDNQHLEIYRFYLGDVSSMEPWTKLTGADTRDGFLCPRKVHGDNFGFVSITSLCSGEIFSDTRVVVFSFPGPRAIIEVALPNNASMVTPQACYFRHSLLIYGYDAVANKTNLFMTNGLEEDSSEEHFGLEDYGLQNVQSVHCAEEQDLFSVVSNNADGTKNIGVFYAHSRGRANMRVHSVKMNLKISNAVSYGVGHGMVHIIYDMNGSPFFMASYLNGPIIYTDVSTDLKISKKLFGNLKSHDKVRNHTVSFLASNPRGDKASLNTPFTLRSQDNSISIKTKKTLKSSETKEIYMEDYLDIDGPVFNVHLTNSAGPVNDSEVIFKHRIHPVEFTKKSAGTEYKYIVMAAERTYAVEAKNDYTIVDLYRHGEFIKTIAGLGIAGEVLAFTAVTIDYRFGTDVLVYSHFEGDTSQIYMQVYQNGIRKSAKVGSGRGFATELKGVRVNGTTVYLFAKNSREVDYYVITVDNLFNPSIQYVNSFWDIMDFSPVFGGRNVALLGFGYDRTHFHGYSISAMDAFNISQTLTLTSQHPYNLFKIGCKNHNMTHMLCVANTEASFITENYIDYGITGIESYTHDKFGYYDGYEVDCAGDFLYMFGKTNKPGIFSMAILTWRTRKSGGNGKLWFGLNLPVPSDRQLDFRYEVPFLSAYDDGDPENPICYLICGFLLDGVVLGVFETDNFRMQIVNSSADLNKYSISFQGLSSSQIGMDSLIEQIGSKDALPWWPFALLIAVLILLAVGFYIYARSKSESQEKDKARYATISEDKKTLQG